MTRNHLSPPIFPHPWASDWGQDQYGLWQAFTYKNIRYAFRWIPPGTFMMGSPDGSGEEPKEEGRYGDEYHHQVTLNRGFWLGETAVTQALWKVVMEIEDSPGYFKGDELPVESISWHDCQNFIEKLQDLHPDLQVRLPWEAEWEYACRAGTKTAFSFGGKEDLNLERVNYSGKWDEYDFDGETKSVKSYPPNNWGLYEMHGNVWEWCQDVWQKNPGTAAQNNPQSTSDDEEADRVLRGGAWYGSGRYVRSAFRNYYWPGVRDGHFGFRLLLRSVSQPPAAKHSGQVAGQTRPQAGAEQTHDQNAGGSEQ